MIAETKRLGGKHTPKRLTGLLLFAVVFLALPWDLASTVSLNLAAIHLSRGASKAIAPNFPYVLVPSGLLELDLAVTRAQQGLREGRTPSRLSCVVLRAHTLSMAWQEARDVVESGACDDATMHGFEALWPIVEGLRAVERGDPVAARQEFRQAIIIGSGLLSLSLDPWLRVPHSGGVTRLAANTPRFLVGHMINYEWQPVPEPVSNYWALVGYDLDEGALETGEPVSVSLFWQPRQANIEPKVGWQPVGSLWREDLRLVNLIPDSGFEWAADEDSGWKGQPNQTMLRVVDRQERLTYVQFIYPDPQGGGTILPSPILPLGDHCGLLVGGWVFSRGGAPTISVVWNGLIDFPDDRPFFSLMEGQRDMSWTHVSALSVASKIGARGVSIYAGNWSSVWGNPYPSKSIVAVDNIFAIPISLPEALEQCSFYMSSQ